MILPNYTASTPPPRSSGLARAGAGEMANLAYRGEQAKLSGVGAFGRGLETASNYAFRITQERHDIDTKLQHAKATTGYEGYFLQLQKSLMDSNVETIGRREVMHKDLMKSMDKNYQETLKGVDSKEAAELINASWQRDRLRYDAGTWTTLSRNLDRYERKFGLEVGKAFIVNGQPEEAEKHFNGLVSRGLYTKEEVKNYQDMVVVDNETQRIYDVDGYQKAAEFVISKKDLDQSVRNKILSNISTQERVRSAKHTQAREETGRQLLANLWDGTLKDPQEVTNAVRAGLIDDTDAKYLRNAIKNPEDPKTTHEAYIAMMYTKDGIAQGTETRESALKQLIKYSGQLSPADGKSFIDDIFGEHDSMNSFWNRESQAYMEKQILEVATMSGILYGSGEQQAMSAKALLAFDTAKKEAAAAGKPLVGRELLIKAHEIMMPFRDKPIIEGEQIPQSLKNLSPQDEIRQSLGLPTQTSGQAAIDAFNKVTSIPMPKTQKEKDALPKGTQYYDPNGVLRTKQ